MHRRAFFAVVALLGLGGITDASKKDAGREFRRFNRATDEWDVVDPRDLKSGDAVWVLDPGGNVNEVQLVSRNEPEERQFYSTHKIDPKTNQWVSHTH